MRKLSIQKVIYISFIVLSFCPVNFAQRESSQQETFITAKGWGKIQLGTAKKVVEKTLGKPDKFDSVSDVSFADYTSKGIQISYLNKSKTVNAIFFYNKQRLDEQFAVFSSGRTHKEIYWSSSEDDVIKAYGKPREDFGGKDWGGTWRRIVYYGIDFRFENKMLVRISVFIEEKKAD